MSSFTKTMTEKQLEANRANALKSTGPQDPEMKAKVSKNRTTHGLCGKFNLLPMESKEEFDALVASFMEAEQPVGSSEEELVVKMAEHTWRARRALRLQDACFVEIDPDIDEIEDGHQGVVINNPQLLIALRYHTFHDRAYRRASQELMERRKQRQLAEIGFERKKQAEAEAKRKAEKHELAQEVVNLKKQLLEIRLTKHLLDSLKQNTPTTTARQVADIGVAA